MADGVIVEKVSKRYQLGQAHEFGMLQDALMGWARRLVREANGERAEPEAIWALKDVTLRIKEGEILGIIGRNGAGKSTLLKILSRITKPTSGSVSVNGRVASLLEVGTGFHEELTARENVFLNGSILGMKRKEIIDKLEAIIAFAGVERFLDTPIKRYSTGMRLRLGFAVAAHLDPDVMLVDEVLAVGDAGFQKKCLGAMDSLRKSGRTILFVSHNMAAVENLCSRVIWVDNGQVRRDGEPRSVIEAYMASFGSTQQANLDLGHIGARRGNGYARFTAMEFVTPKGEPLRTIRTGDRVVIRLHFSVKTRLTSPIFSLAIYTELGTLVSDVSTWATNVDIPFLDHGEGHVELELESLNLMPGRYSLSIFLEAIGPVVFDGLEHCTTFEVEPADFYKSGKGVDSRLGIICLPCKWSLHGLRNAETRESI